MTNLLGLKTDFAYWNPDLADEPSPEPVRLHTSTATQAAMISASNATVGCRRGSRRSGLPTLMAFGPGIRQGTG